MEDRSRVVILREGRVALMRRERAGKLYYVFPGGGIEPGESPEQAAVREAYEELGIIVQPGRLIAVDQWNGVRAFFYLARWVSGEFGTGQGPEYHSYTDRGSYQPVWVEVSALHRLDVRPARVAAAIGAGEIREEG